MAHVDEWMEHPDSDAYASFVLHLFRLPAGMQVRFRKFTESFKLYCDYGGKRYRCTGASRFGDVWLSSDFSRDCGYEHRVDVTTCSKWGPKP